MPLPASGGKKVTLSNSYRSGKRSARTKYGSVAAWVAGEWARVVAERETARETDATLFYNGVDRENFVYSNRAGVEPAHVGVNALGRRGLDSPASITVHLVPGRHYMVAPPNAKCLKHRGRRCVFLGIKSPTVYLEDGTGYDVRFLDTGRRGRVDYGDLVPVPRKKNGGK